MRLNSLSISNYRSFDADGITLSALQPTTVLIGKNNAGKSNVFRFLLAMKGLPRTGKGAAPFNAALDSHRRSSAQPQATVGLLASALLQPLGADGVSRKLIPILVKSMEELIECPVLATPDSPTQFLNKYTTEQLYAFFNHLKPAGPYFTSTPSRERLVDPVYDRLLTHGRGALQAASDAMVYVPHFREIRDRPTQQDGHPEFNGAGILAALHEMQHPRIGDEKKQLQFERIEKFVAELLNESSIRLEVDFDKSTLIVNMHDLRLPISSFGTGIHQLILMCTLFAMHENILVCVEEPEVYLHPQLQRHMIRFMASTNNQYIISTHSNVFLDTGDSMSVFHMDYDGTRTRCEAVDSSGAGRRVLRDIGCRASDLLQANGVVWVEGPSDRLYLLRWLSLIDDELTEGIHFAIMFYGGANLAHFSAIDLMDESGDCKALIEMLRINGNAFVICDRDGDDELSPLKRHVERIKSEIGADHCWICEGREVENYVHSDAWSAVLSETINQPAIVKLGMNDRVDKAIERAHESLRGKKSLYSRQKVAFAKKLTEHLKPEHLEVLDLKPRVLQLANAIRSWNS